MIGSSRNASPVAFARISTVWAPERSGPTKAAGVTYGATEVEAITKAEALALRVLAERLEHAETGPMDVRIVFAAE